MILDETTSRRQYSKYGEAKAAMYKIIWKLLY